MLLVFVSRDTGNIQGLVYFYLWNSWIRGFIQDVFDQWDDRIHVHQRIIVNVKVIDLFTLLHYILPIHKQRVIHKN